MVGAASAACGLLLSHHSYLGDCALLIPLSVLTIQRQQGPAWLRIWALLMLTPLAAMLIASGKPYLGQTLVVSFVAVAVWLGRTDAGRTAKAALTGDSHPAALFSREAVSK